jgi:hypothetical protein
MPRRLASVMNLQKQVTLTGRLLVKLCTDSTMFPNGP